MARVPAETRRLLLLEAALAVFATSGYHATTMEQVADAASVTKPVIYQHFASKRDLYLALLDDLGRRILDVIGKATVGATGPRQQVERGFAAYVRFVAEQPDAFTVLFGSGNRRGDGGEFAEAVLAIESAIADAIAELIDADVDDDHRRLLGQAIVGMAEGTSRHWLAHRLELDPEVLARRLAELAWAGLRSVQRD